MCWFPSYSKQQWLCTERPAVRVLFVWDLEPLLCLFFPDNLSNSTEKEGTECALFFFFLEN